MRDRYVMNLSCMSFAFQNKKIYFDQISDLRFLKKQQFTQTTQPSFEKK